MDINGKKQYRTLLSIEGLGEVVREYRPAKRTIRFMGRDKLIQTPYVIFAFHDGILYVAVAKAPIRDLDDYVYLSPFGNTWRTSGNYHWGRVCGAHGNNLNEAICQFWQTEFNADLGWGTIARERTFGSYREWAELSAQPDSERIVLDRIGYDGILFSQFIAIYGRYWGKWQTYLNENIQIQRRQRPISLFPMHCKTCKMRFYCPGSVVPANINVLKIVWNKTWGVIRWVLLRIGELVD